MPNINGNWFHSRSSSNHNELLTIRTLVHNSRQTQYIGVRWSGNKNEPRVVQLANTVNIDGATLQTKVRAFIRYSFVRDIPKMPLQWTRLGQLWDDLYSQGNSAEAYQVYQLTLAVALAMYSFRNVRNAFCKNPSDGELPLKFLLNNLITQNRVSKTDLVAIIGDRNYNYWLLDLINSGLFIEEGRVLRLSGKFNGLIVITKTFIPTTPPSEIEWIEIRENPFLPQSPFGQFLENELLKIVEGQIQPNETLEKPLEEREELILVTRDVLTEGTQFTQMRRRIRSNAWGKIIKQHHSYQCAMPGCDAHGQFLVIAAHIKPDSVPETDIPHRSHILNGICLCLNCHAAFDYGLFSLTDDARIILSPEVEQVRSQHLINILKSSKGNFIKPREDGRQPLKEFIRYHRENIFKA